MKKLYMIVLCAVTVLCIVFGSLYHLGALPGTGRGFSRNARGGDAVTQGLAAFSVLDIDVEVSNIEVLDGDQFMIDAEWSDERIALEWISDGGILSVRQKAWKNLRFGTGNNNAKCRVYVPRGTTLDRVTARTDVGNVTLTGIIARRADVQSNVGNCSVAQGLIETLSCASDTGNVTVVDVTFTTLEAESDVGNVIVTLPATASYAEYTVDAKTDVGTVHAPGAQKAHSYVQRGTNPAKTIRASSDVGNVTLG